MLAAAARRDARLALAVAQMVAAANGPVHSPETARNFAALQAELIAKTQHYPEDDDDAGPG